MLAGANPARGREAGARGDQTGLLDGVLEVPLAQLHRVMLTCIG